MHMVATAVQTGTYQSVILSWRIASGQSLRSASHDFHARAYVHAMMRWQPEQKIVSVASGAQRGSLLLVPRVEALKEVSKR
jgi:hypothetical protein